MYGFIRLFIDYDKLDEPIDAITFIEDEFRKNIK